MTPNDMMAAVEAGYMSTTEVARRIGLPVNASYIVGRLGIKPTFVFRSGQAVYWSEAQVRAIRLAMIKVLADDAATDALQNPSDVAEDRRGRSA